MLALTGDKVDSIPGIPGVGQKTAARLLKQYGTLEGVVAHSQEIGGKIGLRLRELSQQALLAKKLATVRRDVPIAVSLEALQMGVPEKHRGEYLFRQLGFVKLWDRFEAIQ